MSHFRSTLPDGRLAITNLSGEVTDRTKAVAKTMFELSRPVLTPPLGLSPAEIAIWRMNVHFTDYTGPVPLTCRECPDSELLSDRYFRDAWEDRPGAIIVNLVKARPIHMSRIRQVRDVELAKLDVPFLRAVETGNVLEQQRLAAQKQALRDLPQTFGLETFTTPEALKAAWPTILPRI